MNHTATPPKHTIHNIHTKKILPICRITYLAYPNAAETHTQPSHSYIYASTPNSYRSRHSTYPRDHTHTNTHPTQWLLTTPSHRKQPSINNATPQNSQCSQTYTFRPTPSKPKTNHNSAKQTHPPPKTNLTKPHPQTTKKLTLQMHLPYLITSSFDKWIRRSPIITTRNTKSQFPSTHPNPSHNTPKSTLSVTLSLPT